MQSDGNSFCRDVDWDSVYTVNKNEGSILDQIYEKQVTMDLYYEDFKPVFGVRTRVWKIKMFGS